MLERLIHPTFDRFGLVTIELQVLVLRKRLIIGSVKVLGRLLRLSHWRSHRLWHHWWDQACFGRSAATVWFRALRALIALLTIAQKLVCQVFFADTILAEVFNYGDIGFELRAWRCHWSRVFHGKLDLAIFRQQCLFLLLIGSKVKVYWIQVLVQIFVLETLQLGYHQRWSFLGQAIVVCHGS